MIPYTVGKLAPSSSHLTRGLVEYVPGRGYSRAVPSQNRDKYVTTPPLQSLNLSNEFVYLEGNVNHDADLSIEVNRRIRNAWCRFRKYTLELYDRPSAPLELKIQMLRVEVFETMLCGCVTWSPRVVPLRHAAPNQPYVLDSLHRLVKAQWRRPPDFLSIHAYQDGK